MWRYLFTHAPGGETVPPTHSEEIDYVFGNLGAHRWIPRAPMNDVDRHISETMMVHGLGSPKPATRMEASCRLGRALTDRRTLTLISEIRSRPPRAIGRHTSMLFKPSLPWPRRRNEAAVKLRPDELCTALDAATHHGNWLIPPPSRRAAAVGAAPTLPRRRLTLDCGTRESGKLPPQVGLQLPTEVHVGRAPDDSLSAAVCKVRRPMHAPWSSNNSSLVDRLSIPVRPVPSEAALASRRWMPAC